MIAFVQTSPQGQTGCSFLQRAQMKHKLSHARLTSSFGILSILSMIRNTSGTWSVATPKLSKMADRTVRLDTLKTTSFCSKPAAHDLLECLMQRTCSKTCSKPFLCSRPAAKINKSNALKPTADCSDRCNKNNIRDGMLGIDDMCCTESLATIVLQLIWH